MTRKPRFLSGPLAIFISTLVLSTSSIACAQGSRSDPAETTEIELTCDSDDPEECSELGWTRFGQNRDNPASRHLAMACLKESGMGCFRLGEHYLFVKNNPKYAFDAYFEACRRGISTGCAAWTVLNLYGEKTTNKEWALEVVEMVEGQFCGKKQDGQSCWWMGQLHQAIGDDIDKAKMYKKLGLELLKKDCDKGISASCRMFKLLSADNSK